MALNLGTQQLLSNGTKYFSYSGLVVGDITVPASISLITIENTGLRDSLVCLYPFFAAEITSNVGDALGLIVSIDDIEVFKSQVRNWNRENTQLPPMESKLFIPRQSKLQVLSLNTAGNNTQERGCNLIGYYL
jgi:hypothetical protein|tara:strand:- start:6 stop:404 length:399 start_codon:yes stop_codon:yes gene_type:complete